MVEKSEDGETNCVFTDEFDNLTVSSLRDEIMDTLDELSNMCRESYSRGVCDFCYADEIPRAKDSRDWLINGIIKERTFNEIIAPSKSGKSQLGYQLAYEVQNGMPFVDCYETKQCDVLYVDCELSPREIYDRETNLREFKKGNQRFKILSTANENINTNRIINEIKRSIRKNNNISLVVLDNFYSFVDGEFDTNDVGEVKELLSKLKFEITNLGVAVVLINHTNKSVSSDLGTKPDYEITEDYILNSAFGSLAHGAKVDTSMLLQKKVDTKIIHITGRNVSPIIRIACDSNEKNNWFFSPVGGCADSAINTMSQKEIKNLDTYFKNMRKNEISYNTIKTKGSGRILSMEMLKQAGFKIVMKVTTNENGKKIKNYFVCKRENC